MLHFLKFVARVVIGGLIGGCVGGAIAIGKTVVMKVREKRRWVKTQKSADDYISKHRHEGSFTSRRDEYVEKCDRMITDIDHKLFIGDAFNDKLFFTCNDGYNLIITSNKNGIYINNMSALIYLDKLMQRLEYAHNLPHNLNTYILDLHIADSLSEVFLTDKFHEFFKK